MVDVLSFVEVQLPWFDGGAGAGSRQLAINGNRLDDLAGGTTSSLLVDGVDADVKVGYLKELLGTPVQPLLPGSRSTLGYCDQCLDNDGWLLATYLTMTAKQVEWRSVGFDHENGFPLVKEGPWWRRTAVPAPADWEWWIEQERDTELSFRFNRSQYEAAIQAELDRIKGSA